MVEQFAARGQSPAQPAGETALSAGEAAPRDTQCLPQQSQGRHVSGVGAILSLAARRRDTRNGSLSPTGPGPLLHQGPCRGQSESANRGALTPTWRRLIFSPFSFYFFVNLLNLHSWYVPLILPWLLTVSSFLPFLKGTSSVNG